MKPEDLNRALALSFEPEPPNEWKSGQVLSQLRCWWRRDFNSGWQPRDFTEPELLWMCVTWLLSERCAFEITMLDGLYAVTGMWGGWNGYATTPEAAVLMATARARNIFVDTPTKAK